MYKLIRNGNVPYFFVRTERAENIIWRVPVLITAAKSSVVAGKMLSLVIKQGQAVRYIFCPALPGNTLQKDAAAILHACLRRLSGLLLKTLFYKQVNNMLNLLRPLALSNRICSFYNAKTLKSLCYNVNCQIFKLTNCQIKLWYGFS